ncbi:enamine deaminase RidA [Solitalea longa]|uniref:Enamine deaminase RidA n=1 Tax=Solitalea longa TaxID=2079460 RepID=A0A2S5A5C8_9SPHI|nr:RidA family protein [Solitalea longa]POY37801.1 enamine deaminase RidA [Solitalea longa]
MTPVFSTEVPSPAGHYNQGMAAHQFIFISGQLPTGFPAETSLEEQVKIALQRVIAIAEAGGSSIEKIVKTTVYIADVNDWPAVNAAYAEFFGPNNKPARSIVPVPALHYGYKVEIEAIAAI